MLMLREGKENAATLTIGVVDGKQVVKKDVWIFLFILNLSVIVGSLQIGHFNNKIEG